MPERRCTVCESSFYTTTDAWGDQLCGDCLADRIEATLLGLQSGRKPMRRAAAVVADQAQLPAERQRRTG